MVARVAPPYRPGVAATIIFRAFRLSTWRETAYLLVGGLVAIAAFVVLVTGVSVGLALVITFVGIPILAATALAARGIAWVERWRVALLGVAPLEGRYSTGRETGFWRRILALARDVQTWKDVGWLPVLSVVGFAFALVPLVALADGALGRLVPGLVVGPSRLLAARVGQREPDQQLGGGVRGVHLRAAAARGDAVDRGRAGEGGGVSRPRLPRARRR
jgi:hypothetical protein